MVGADLVHAWSHGYVQCLNVLMFLTFFWCMMGTSESIRANFKKDSASNFERKSWGEQNHHKNAVSLMNQKAVGKFLLFSSD